MSSEMVVCAVDGCGWSAHIELPEDYDPESWRGVVCRNTLAKVRVDHMTRRHVETDDPSWSDDLITVLGEALVDEPGEGTDHSRALEAYRKWQERR